MPLSVLNSNNADSRPLVIKASFNELDKNEQYSAMVYLCNKLKEFQRKREEARHNKNNSLD